MWVRVATAGVGSSLAVFSQWMAWTQSMTHDYGRCGLLHRYLLDVGIGPAPAAIVDGSDFVTLINCC